ncbi:MAG: glycosyltransferase [Thermodesulfobacteriota bacterium]
MKISRCKVVQKWEINNKLSMPKVSVIIPTYNRANFLEEAIESVLFQNYKDFELIVVDDGSTDETRNIVRRYTDEIVYIYQNKRGVSCARNMGIKNSSGEYIAFLDSDDKWSPDKLAYQMDFFAHNPDALICYTEEIWFRNNARVNPMRKHRKYSGMIFDKVLPLCIISPSSVMLKRELFFDRIGFFDESLPACEDYDMWIKIAASYPIYLIETPLIIKRGGHHDQLSRNFVGLDRFRIKALVNILESGILSPEQYKASLKELRKKCTIFGNGCLKRGRIAEGERYLKIPDKYEIKLYA